MSFCQQHKCAHCCVEGEVPLLNEDIDRITAMGYFDVYFAVDHAGIKVMRKLDGKCIFFQQGVCEIYERRPTRCRYFPMTYNSERDCAEIEETCPYKDMYQITPSGNEELCEYVHRLQREFELRTHSGRYYNHSGSSHNSRPVHRF